MADNQQAAAGIEFSAAIAKITTMADQGIRLVIDLPEDAIIEAAWLMQAKRAGVAIRVSIVAE